jgi:flavodoxin
MNTIILYDSQFGNTEKLAQIIAKSISSAKLLRANEVSLEDLKDIDLFVVGSPTQGGRATVLLQQFLDQIPSGKLTNIKVAAFDTRFSEKDVNFALRLLMKTIDYAAPKMAKLLTDKGGKLIVQPEGFIVKGKKGPLVDGELDRARTWIKLRNGQI